MKYVLFMSQLPHTIKILISKWPRTRKFSHLFKNTGGGKIFSYDSHTLVTLYVQFLCSDCSKFDRWVHAENLCSILKLVYFDSWNWQSFVSACDVWMYKMNWKYSCFQKSSVIHGWFVYWVFGWEVRRLWILDGIVVVFHLAWCVRGFKSLKRFWPYLIAFRSCISNGKPE